MKMIRYSSKDRYIYKYSDALYEHVRKELDISGEEESWNELRKQCRANAMKRCVNKQKMLCIIMITEHLYIFERNTGIEPASQAWEARALPMC